MSSQGSHLRLLEVVLRNMTREREKGKELHQSYDDALSMFFFFTWKSPGWSGRLLNYSEKT